MVGAHPAGRFGMSGTDFKAGGRDYLLLFTQAKSIAEKGNSATMQRCAGIALTLAFLGNLNSLENPHVPGCRKGGHGENQRNH